MMQRRLFPFRALLAICVTLTLLGVVAAGALAAPKADLWERWTVHAPASTVVIDHSAWDRLLARHVKAGADGLNRFDYGRVTAAERAALKTYIGRLGATAVSDLARPEQLAYWVNLYNALTVQVVLDHYPVASIRDIDISPGFFADGPWGARLVTVEGEALSLDDIEHRILRPIWRDPRIHYVVNCASVGCPNLAARAYTAASMETMLDAAARAYVNDPRGVRAGRDGLTVSSIYVWFRDDFGGADAAVIAHLRRYAGPRLRESLTGRTAIDRHAYDWSLNGVRDAF